VTELDAIEVRPRPCWIAGSAEQGATTVTVRHPYDGTEIADVAVPSATQVERAVAAAAAVARSFAGMDAETRADALRAAALEIADRAEEIAETLTAEHGTPLRRAHAEVADAIATFHAAADETTRLDGEVRRRATGLVLVRRRSRGPVLVLTAGSFVELASQVAAAIAVGAPVVVRPGAPMTAVLLGEIPAATELPSGAFSVLPAVDGLLAEPRLPVVSFTGAEADGWAVRDAAPSKHIVLDVGSTAAIVCADADVATAARRIADAGVRRVVVQTAAAQAFLAALGSAVSALRTGDPHDPAVDVGPLLDEAAAEQVVEWLGRAGDVRVGGTRVGATVAPTVVVTDVDDVVAGPVFTVSVVDTADAAYRMVHGPRLAVFTADMRTALDADATVAATTVVVGDVPPVTGPDRMRAAMLDLTEERILVLTD
jgi:acyl-CoA reductase-like NAD-dependent aldehyde dehydrogenase